MKRILLLSLLTCGITLAQPPAPKVTWDQFLTWIQPNSSPRVAFEGPAWIWEFVKTLPLTYLEKVQIANQLWVSYWLAGLTV